MNVAYQPPSRTRFYRDKRNGKVMGICAGIADYTGFDISLADFRLWNPAFRKHSTVRAGQTVIVRAP